MRREENLKFIPVFHFGAPAASPASAVTDGEKKAPDTNEAAIEVDADTPAAPSR